MIDTPELARLYLIHMHRYYGPATTIISDRGPQFVNGPNEIRITIELSRRTFWQAWCAKFMRNYRLTFDYMPLWRYVANRGLTLAGNLLLGTKISEFHTGYRAFAAELLNRLPLSANSDDFVFDNQILAETVWLNYPIGEVSCPTSYSPDASSINFRRSVRYGFGCLGTALRFRLAKLGLYRSNQFPVLSAPTQVRSV